MSYITRRAISTIVPPRVASPSGIGAAKDAQRMRKIVDLYEKLPKGPGPKIQGKGLIGRYQARYFGDKPSSAPIYHFIGFFLAFGYLNEYVFHLHDHKNNAH